MTQSRTRRRPVTIAAAAVAAVGLTLLGALPASAHVSATSSTDVAGEHAVITFSVPHGCEDSPTTEVSIQIPEGINSVTPTRNPYYDVENVVADLDEPVTDGHGNEVTTRVSEVVYTAIDPLPAGQRDALELSLQLPADAAGSTLYFPTVQTCDEGETAWVEVPADGQDSHDLDAPAPAVAVVAASGEDDADTDAGAAPAEGSADAAPADGSGSSAGPLSVVALVLGVLGTLVGGLALARGRARS